MLPLNLMSQKQQQPPPNKQRPAPDPFRQNEQYDPRKNQRDSDSMEQLVPAGSVLVIILRHVVRQSGHSAPPCLRDITSAESPGSRAVASRPEGFFSEHSDSISKKLKWLD